MKTKTHVIVQTIYEGEYVLPKISIFVFKDTVGAYWVDVLSRENWRRDEITKEEYNRLKKELL